MKKKYTRRIKSRQMNEGYPLNSKKRIITEGTSPCYTRIEPEAGGAADRRRIHAPCIEAAAYLTDARANRPLVEGGQRSGKPPTPRVPQARKKMLYFRTPPCLWQFPRKYSRSILQLANNSSNNPQICKQIYFFCRIICTIDFFVVSLHGILGMYAQSARITYAEK